MGKLEESRHFIDLYLHMIGLNEVPREFHLWSCLSLIAACLGDRCWVNKDTASNVYPNLYVFLVGPSGCGKDQAIKTVMKLVADLKGERNHKLVNIWSGKMTGPAMWEYLSKSGAMTSVGQGKHKEVTSVKPVCYYMTEELGACVRSGELGQDLIATMTAFYMRPAQISDGTRQHGFIHLLSPTVNWLAGTTDEWMLRSVPKDSVEGGFLARVQVVRGNRNYSVRYPRMLYPVDYQEVREHLLQRIEDLIMLDDAEFVLNDEALKVHDDWYLNEKPPDDSVLLPAFNRSDDLIYKLSLLLAIAEWTGRDTVDEHGGIVYDATIYDRHVKEAIELWRAMLYDMPATIRVANANPQMVDVDIVRHVVRRAGTMARSEMMTRVVGKGINKDRLDRALETLFAEECVKEHSEMGKGTRPKVWYTWEGGE